MGWTYEYRIAYGITVNAWDNPGLEDLLKLHSDILSYDSSMSLKGQGTLFIYLKSSYKILNIDRDFFSRRCPATDGTDFIPPKRPIIHKIDTHMVQPTQSNEELASLKEIKKFCKTRSKPVWIKHSHILY